MGSLDVGGVRRRLAPSVAVVAQSQGEVEGVLGCLLEFLWKIDHAVDSFHITFVQYFLLRTNLILNMMTVRDGVTRFASVRDLITIAITFHYPFCQPFNEIAVQHYLR